MLEAREKTKAYPAACCLCTQPLEHRQIVFAIMQIWVLDDDGHTCLIKAAVNGRADVHFCSWKQTRPHTRDRDSKLKWSACHYAVFAGRSEIIAAEQQGCDLDMKDGEGLTPYALAGVVPDRDDIRSLLVNHRIQSVYGKHSAWVESTEIEDL